MRSSKRWASTSSLSNFAVESSKNTLRSSFGLVIGILLVGLAIAFGLQAKEDVMHRVKVTGLVTDFDFQTDEDGRRSAEIVSYVRLDGSKDTVTDEVYTSSDKRRGEERAVVYDTDSVDAYIGDVPLRIWWAVALLLVSFALLSFALAPYLSPESESTPPSISPVRTGAGGLVMLAPLLFVMLSTCTVSSSCSTRGPIAFFPIIAVALLAFVAFSLPYSLGTWGLVGGGIGAGLALAFPDLLVPLVWGTIAGVVSIAPFHFAVAKRIHHTRSVRGAFAIAKRKAALATIKRFANAAKGNDPRALAIEKVTSSPDNEVRVLSTGEHLPFDGDLPTGTQFLVIGGKTSRLVPSKGYRATDTEDVIQGDVMVVPEKPKRVLPAWFYWSLSTVAFALAVSVVTFVAHAPPRDCRDLRQCQLDQTDMDERAGAEH